MEVRKNDSLIGVVSERKGFWYARTLNGVQGGPFLNYQTAEKWLFALELARKKLPVHTPVEN